MGFLTPESFPAAKKRRVLDIPVDPDFLSVFTGALLPLMDPANWQQCGAISPEDAAAMAQSIILASLDNETDLP